MNLSDEKIIEFQKIYQECFGKEISKESAYENGMKLLQLISVIYCPVDKNELKYEITNLTSVEKGI